jgi:hypothetical protein
VEAVGEREGVLAAAHEQAEARGALGGRVELGSWCSDAALCGEEEVCWARRVVRAVGEARARRVWRLGAGAGVRREEEQCDASSEAERQEMALTRRWAGPALAGLWAGFSRSVGRLFSGS